MSFDPNWYAGAMRVYGFVIDESGTYCYNRWNGLHSRDYRLDYRPDYRLDHGLDSGPDYRLD